mmetsp:Transcript_85735/g.216229  ORF Transcript_85735/g.216229 Transcript_85735/m.216229 type:complete len:115 (+) Transcript_85735:740-1084(+)
MLPWLPFLASGGQRRLGVSASTPASWLLDLGGTIKLAAVASPSGAGLGLQELRLETETHVSVARKLLVGVLKFNAQLGVPAVTSCLAFPALARDAQQISASGIEFSHQCMLLGL